MADSGKRSYTDGSLRCAGIIAGIIPYRIPSRAKGSPDVGGRVVAYHQMGFGVVGPRRQALCVCEEAAVGLVDPYVVAQNGYVDEAAEACAGYLAVLDVGKSV